jgi:putative methanogenesis marker protein 17
MALDYFEVECSEKKGGDTYLEIASDVLKDLNLLSIISRLHIYIDPEFPLFVAVGQIRKMPGVVRAGDFTNIMEKEGKIVIDVGEETYLSNLLSKLWEKYGRENVDQPDRFTITINPENKTIGEIEKIVVLDHRENIYKDIIYALQWIAPEGFRIRKEGLDKSTFYYISSENTIPQEMAEELVSNKTAIMKEEK